MFGQLNDREVSEDENLSTCRVKSPRDQQAESPLLENREKRGTPSYF